MVEGVRQVAALPDPVGQVIESSIRPNGLDIRKVSVPIGVIGIIYESRPNVTIDCAALCLKSGNASILRGGKEAFHSNTALAELVQDALEETDVPQDAVLLIPTTDREALNHLLKQDENIHCIIPRGGEALIRFVTEHSRIPVIKHCKGVCNLYVDSKADLDVARKIAITAKCGRPGVCNAIENLIVHREIASAFLPETLEALAESNCEVRADAEARSILNDARPSLTVGEATEEDFHTEFLDLILSIKIVDSLEDAIDAVNRYGSGHSDAIVTTDELTAERFLAAIDTSTVYWNASTRFTDGFEFGLGSEIGISTDRLHARGPMGLRELCTYKYQVRGNGQTK
jgi:glutamate-5-semialdehyde dehydrogenase